MTHHGQSKTVVISGIGTGGHYFPALVVAQELVKRKKNVIFLVRRGYAEEEIAQMHGLKTFAVTPKPFFGKSLSVKIISIVVLFKSVHALNKITKRVVALAFGGFGALPLLISCLLNRSPFFLFEPNRIPGRATRLFAQRARSVLLGMPLATSLKAKTVVTGIPLRSGFKRIISQRAKPSSRKRVLFIGGSQGARTLNKLALQVQSVLPQDFRITIITGRRDYDWVNAQRNGRTTVIPFTLSPWDEISQASVVVSRAGALAGYEILSLTKSAIFVPFPFAIDNHQYFNAQYFVEVAGSVLVEEKNLRTDAMIQLIKQKTCKTPRKKPGIIFDAEKRIADIIVKHGCTRSS